MTLTENDALIDLTEFRDMADFEASVASIREGLADLDAGRTISLAEMTAELGARAAVRRRQRDKAQETEGVA